MSDNQPKLARVEFLEHGSKCTMIVRGGLHYIRGNFAPYFSLTADIYEGGVWASGGCQHEAILKHCPQFADLAALHLSTIDGTPMHAVDNGMYFLGGARSTGHFGSIMPAANYKHAAEHFRIMEDEARALVRDLFGDHYSEAAGFMTHSAKAAATDRLAIWVETQRPRWKREATECIARHGLVVYGDAWKEGQT